MLKDIDLKDIYLGKEYSLLTGVPGTNDPIPAPADCYDELTEIRKVCEEASAKSNKEEFAIRHNNVAYCVSIMETLTDTVFVLRRFPNAVPNLGDLNIHPGYVDMLMQAGLTGLIIVSGAYGQGKTTTASSIIASRLNKHGGVAITIEDPPEMPLERRHGEGQCYQTWVDRGEFGDACRKAARWAPSIIFLGEVRDQETAAEALRASINGRLVICTIHADSVPMAIERIYTLAKGHTGDSDDISSLLANGLLCVMQQKLVNEPKTPKIDFLWLGGDEDETKGARNNIRVRRWEQISNEVTLQLNRMLMVKRSPTPSLAGATSRI